MPHILVKQLQKMQTYFIGNSKNKHIWTSKG